MFGDYKIKNYNFKLYFVVLVILGIGTVVIQSADSSYLKKQLIGVIFCVVGMTFLSFVDYKWICKFYVLLYILNLGMLLLVKFAGKEVNGAKRWFELIEDSLTIQPSEFTKIIMILVLAALLSKMKETLNTWHTLLILAGVCAVPLFLVVSQPDLSTTIDIFAILFIMIFVAGLSYKILGITILILIPFAGSFLWYIQTPNQILLTENQVGRILAFLYPSEYANTAYQQTNSIMAIGSGMLTGKGLSSSTIATVKDANFISEQQTDFIFSVVGEELGFVGSTLIIAIIMFIVFECIRTARKAKDFEGMLIATGVAAFIGVQTFINVGVATGILPNTGIPLPFVSYGLSSLVSACAGMGLVLNISLQRKKY